jgi:dTDP-4-dehydrorhamnose reductase
MGGKNGMKVLVAGAGGMLGRDLTTCLSERGYEILALPHDELDITDLKAVRTAADEFEPGLVINCAAYTKVDEAEKEEPRALMVNGLGVQNICLACQQRDVPLVHFSTDYIFDGAKEVPYTIYDEPNPISAYGRSKLLGERYLLWLLSRFYLIRTSWLFGLHGKNFIETMLELGQREKQISVIKDQKGCPTWSYHLVQAVVELIQTERYGIYHITNSEPTTWYDFAREIFRICEMDVEVLPVTSDKFPRPAMRPQNSILDPFPLPQVLGREMPSWREALKEYIERRDA